MPEKLPGPEFTIIEKFLSILTPFCLINSTISLTIASLFFILLLSFFMKKLFLNFKPNESFLPVMLIIKKSFIILLFIVFFTAINNSYSQEGLFEDHGVIAIMYHRFEENKYPSTNVRIKDFKDHIRLLKDNKIKIINPNNFEKSLREEKKQKKVLLTIDDAFSSFYVNAWPILKESETPFILFVSTREVGKFNYMTWKQIQEISKKSFVHVGNHSHTHEYLIDQDSDKIKKDIQKSMSILEEKIGYKTNFFSYPFGEYSLEFKKIIKDLKFKYAFGQHSGVADDSKDFFELPRFPINEKYGEIKRFNTILNTLPLKFQKLSPEEKYINDLTNPPKINIKFFKDIKNLKLINCFSNEEDRWRKSNIRFIDDSTIEIKLDGKFTTERGRVNCSIREANNTYRWLGLQFVVAEK